MVLAAGTGGAALERLHPATPALQRMEGLVVSAQQWEELPVLVKTRTRRQFNGTPNEVHWKPLKQTLRAKHTINWWDPSPQDAAQAKGLVEF